MDYEPITVNKKQVHVPESNSWVELAVAIAFIFVGFIVLDILLPKFFADQGFFWVILLNVAVAQLTLICIWGTLVEGTFWLRIPWTLLLLVISWAALSAGLYIERGHLESDMVLGLGLVWLFGFVVSYFPLKIAAWLFGWRITQSKSPVWSASNRFAIRDMMIGTAILAGVMAIGRFLLPGEMPPWSAVYRASEMQSPEMPTLLGIFSVVSLIVKLPCIWIALAMTKEKVIIRGAIWTVLSGLIGLIEFGIFCMLLGSPGRDWWEIVVGICVGHMAMAAVMIGVLYVLRSFGYSMSRIRKSSSAQITKT